MVQKVLRAPIPGRAAAQGLRVPRLHPVDQDGTRLRGLRLPGAPGALDFDHLPGSVKKGRLASMACGSALKTIHAEIDKCEVVCANCHRVRTANRRKAAGEDLDPLEGS
jgi:hypothetical protein